MAWTDVFWAELTIGAGITVRGGAVKIVVDGNEAMCGLAGLLAEEWACVEVRRLASGDVAVGDRVRIERKTVDDYLASLADGRLFRQAAKLAATVPRPVFILEGDRAVLARRMEAGALRGVELAIALGFRIPVLATRDLRDTASCIRHMAAQEARRETRRRRLRTPSPRQGGRVDQQRRKPLSPEAFNTLLALPGVGRERAYAIAAKVGSLSELCRLGVRDLMAVPGIGPDTAARIIDTLRGRSIDGSR